MADSFATGVPRARVRRYRATALRALFAAAAAVVGGLLIATRRSGRAVVAFSTKPLPCAIGVVALGGHGGRRACGEPLPLTASAAGAITFAAPVSIAALRRTHGGHSDMRRLQAQVVHARIPAALVDDAGVSGRRHLDLGRDNSGGVLRRVGRAMYGFGSEEPPATPGPSNVPAPSPVRMPVVSTASGNIDVMSRLLQDRVLMLSGPVNDETANVLIAQMLYLANQDSSKDITIYINSPGGSVSAGLAIFDAMQFVPCDVATVCFGTAASMGAFLLGAGTKGKRKSLPNGRIMIHQPLGGAGGQAADIEIQAKEILFLREILDTHLADFTSQTVEKVREDCDRDYFMTAEEAVEYGIIDAVVTTKSWPRLTKPPRPAL
eukprot:TRINITY_DN29728_c0_g1_i1.p1 TRINITY_DN29728_c0_g1~~TRINITY_DN29728_c0_g1_i1.p1  ORF type:complete len:378 (-),score=77.32 TRINITY_DN29728_c0_g1_i1:8-1141(-)